MILELLLFLQFSLGSCIFELIGLTTPGIDRYEQKRLSDHFNFAGLMCFSDFNVKQTDIKALKAFQVPKSPEGPCYFACILHKVKMLDERTGLLLPKNGKSMAKKLFTKRHLDNVLRVFDECSFVNDLPVTDGTKGCERSMLLIRCLSRVKPMHTPKTYEIKDTAKLIAKQMFPGVPTVCSKVITIRRGHPMSFLTNFFPVQALYNLCRIINYYD